MNEEWGNLIFEAKAENDQTHRKIEFIETLSFYERGILISPWMQRELLPRNNDYYDAAHIFVTYDQIDEINIMNDDSNFFEGLGGKIPRITIKTDNQKMYILNLEECIYYSDIKNNYWRNIEIIYRFFIKIKGLLIKENLKHPLTISKSNFKPIFDRIGKETKIDKTRNLNFQIFPTSISGAVGGLFVNIPIVILLFYILLDHQNHSSIVPISKQYIVILIILAFTLGITWSVGGWIGGKTKDRIFLFTPVLFNILMAIIILVGYFQSIVNGNNEVNELLVILNWISISILSFFVWFGLYPELRILFQKDYYKNLGHSIAGWTITLLLDAFLFQFIMNIPLLIVAVLFATLGGYLMSQTDKEEFDKLINILYYELSMSNKAINLSTIKNLSSYRILNNHHINQLIHQLNGKMSGHNIVVKFQESHAKSNKEYLIALDKNVKGKGWRTLNERKIQNGKFIFSPTYSFRLAIRSKRYRIIENIVSSILLIFFSILGIGIFSTFTLIPLTFYLLTIVPLDPYITYIHSTILIYGLLGTLFFTATWFNISLKKINLRQFLLNFETKVGIFQNGLFLPSWIQKGNTPFNEIFIPFISISNIIILRTWDEVKSKKYKSDFMIITAFRNQSFSLRLKGTEEYLHNGGNINELKLVYDFFKILENNIDNLKSNSINNLEMLYINSTI